MKPGDLAHIRVGGVGESTALVLRSDEVNQERGEPWWYVLIDGREVLVHEKFLERVEDEQSEAR